MQSMLKHHPDHARVERIQEASAQSQGMERLFKETRDFFAVETRKLTDRLAQTVLDVEGLNVRVRSIDMDLRATSEVAAFASDYLEQVAQGYCPPDNVEYKNIVSPGNTPAKAYRENNLSIRPPLGGASLR